MARVIGTLAASGDTQAPTQPQNLSATAINRQRVDLSWTASTDNVGVTGYQIFRDDSPLDTSATTTYSDTSVSASTAYAYTVVAFDAAGNNSIASASAGATTPANASPTWDTIADQTLIVGDSYSLNLNDVCDDADADTIEYSIFSGTLPSGLALVGGIISGTPTTAGQNPTVTVRAFDGFDNVDTDIVYETFTADVTAPPVPTGVSATAVSSSQINVTWTASQDAAGSANEYVSGTQDYRVYRSTDQTNFSLRTTVTTTSYSDTGLSSGTRYDYKIAARDVELNESAQSSAANATPTASTVDPVLDIDWRARAGGPGVVWGHDFRTAAEVNQFRYANGYGHDPNDVARPGQTIWLSTDGITGGCMESRHTGTQNPPDCWIPMAPLNGASNGRGVDDPAASGTLTLRSYSPNPAGGDTAHNSLQAVNHYGHASYHAANPSAFVGTEYWFQMRCKISANRPFVGSGPAGDEGGKLLYFTTMRRSNSNQEIVTNSYYEVTNFGAGRNLFQMYRSGGTGLPSDNGGNPRQIGGEYLGGVCQTSPTLNSSGCWFWPTDETSEGAGDYVTLLYHVIPGTDSGNNTTVECWKAEWGETFYTRLWRQTNVDLIYDNDTPFGHNGIILSGYQNEIEFSEPVWHRYAQTIFSHNWIPPPQAYDTTSNALIAEAMALSPGQSTSDIGGTNGSTGLTDAVLGSIQWVNRFHYDHERRRAYLLGKWHSNGGSPLGGRSLSVYNASANTWTASDIFHIGGTESGHVYESFTYDPKAQQLYSGRYSTSAAAIQIHTIGDSLTNWTTTATPPWGFNSNGPQPPLCWHPNLFGVGDGGLICLRLVSGNTMQLVTWRKVTDTWTANLVQYSAATAHGAMTYVRHLDAVFYSHANSNAYRIGPGSNGTAATPVQITATPIACRHAGGGDNYGILIDDPAGRAGPYIIEKGGTGNRVWKYEGTSWTLKSYTHPFPNGSGTTDTDWCIASCFPLGVFMCRRDVTSSARLLWRPND